MGKIRSGVAMIQDLVEDQIVIHDSFIGRWKNQIDDDDGWNARRDMKSLISFFRTIHTIWDHILIGEAASDTIVIERSLNI